MVEGKAEFGLTLSGEIASVPGAVIAGPLPPPFGQDTIYCAAVMAASAAKEAAQDFIAALTRPGARPDWTRAGFELPTRSTGEQDAEEPQEEREVQELRRQRADQKWRQENEMPALRRHRLQALTAR